MWEVSRGTPKMLRICQLSFLPLLQSGSDPSHLPKETRGTEKLSDFPTATQLARRLRASFTREGRSPRPQDPYALLQMRSPHETPESSQGSNLSQFIFKYLEDLYLITLKSSTHQGGKQSGYVQENAIPMATSRRRHRALGGLVFPCSPTVFHKVMYNFVQDLLEQRRANPQVFDGKWGQVRQLWQLPHILLEALDLVSPSRISEGEENTFTKEKIPQDQYTNGKKFKLSRKQRSGNYNKKPQGSRQMGKELKKSNDTQQA